MLAYGFHEPDGVKGEYAPRDNGRGVIRFNMAYSPPTQARVLVHEIAHHLLMSEVSGDLFGNGCAATMRTIRRTCGIRSRARSRRFVFGGFRVCGENEDASASDRPGTRRSVPSGSRITRATRHAT